MAAEVALALILSLANLVFAVSVSAIVWFCQRVHYPLYRAVPPVAFATYFRQHLQSARTMLAVPLLCEAVATTALAFVSRGVVRPLAYLGLALFLAGLFVTATTIERSYRALSRGFDARELAVLLRWNLVRAHVWSGRSAIGVVAVWLSR
jgi:hypothetical protein